MTTLTLTESQRAFLDSLQLARGQHESIEQGACVMELVAYVAGEPHSDHPKCACPVITELCIRLNDHWSAERRQKLKPYVLRLVGTRADRATEVRRAYLCADWVVRDCLPMVMEDARLGDWAGKLRALSPIKNKKTAAAGRDMAKQARRAADAAYAYAADAAYDYAYAADAAAAAAYAYAYAADAAYAYADAAAYDYADAAAAAYAYGEKPVHTRDDLDRSVLALLDRLIEAKGGAR